MDNLIIIDYDCMIFLKTLAEVFYNFEYLCLFFTATAGKNNNKYFYNEFFDVITVDYFLELLNLNFTWLAESRLIAESVIFDWNSFPS